MADGPRQLSVAVYGCGAVGLTLAGILAEAGKDVTLVARGAKLAQLRAHGFTLKLADRDVAVGSAGDRFHVEDSGAPPPRGAPDLLVVGLKGHQLEPTLPSLLPWIGPETVVFVAQNGIPYWYCQGQDAGLANGHQLKSIPEAVYNELLPRGLAHLGGVLYLTSFIDVGSIGEPLKVKCPMLRRIVIGAGRVEVSSCRKAAEDVCAFLSTAGVPGVEVSTRIRYDVWHKLLGNLSMNAVSALTLQPLGYVAGQEHTKAILRVMMTETLAIAIKLGIFKDGDIDIEARISISPFSPTSGFKTSTLQDVEAGRQPEIGPLWGSALDLAAIAEVEAPTLSLMHALLRARADAMESAL